MAGEQGGGRRVVVVDPDRDHDDPPSLSVSACVDASAYADRAESLLHPWIVRRVGVHRGATVIAGFGAQFVVPGFVAVDLA